MLKKRKNVKKEEIKKANTKLDKKYVTYEQRVLRKIALGVFLLIGSIILIFLSLKININSNLMYYQTSNLDYHVNLKPNDYYDQKTLGKNMSYVASLIDTINVDFNYNFRTSDKLDYKYNYYIEAETVVKQDQGDNVIFSKKEKIVNDKSQSLKDNDNFSINEKVMINYDKYNDVVKSFKSSYALSAKSELILTLYVNIVDEEGNELKTLNADNKMNITVPLTEQMIDIKMNYKEVNNSDSLVTNTNVSINSKPLFVLGITLVLFFIVDIVKLIILLSKVAKKKTPYDLKLGKILREFDRIIVESKKDIIIDENQDIIDVKTFEELLDVRDNLEKPILFYELHKGQKCIFIVKNNYEVYRYILKAVDLEKKKK